MDSLGDFHRTHRALRQMDRACCGVRSAAGTDLADAHRTQVLLAADFIRNAFPSSLLGAWRNSGRSVDRILRLGIDVARRQGGYRDFVEAFYASDLSRLAYKEACRSPLIFVAAVFHTQLHEAGAVGAAPVRWDYVLRSIFETTGNAAALFFMGSSPAAKLLASAEGIRYNQLDFESRVRCHQALDSVSSQARAAAPDAESAGRDAQEVGHLQQLVREKLSRDSEGRGEAVQSALLKRILVAALASALLACGLSALGGPSLVLSMLWTLLAFPVLFELSLWLGEQVVSKKSGVYLPLKLDLERSGVAERIWVIVPVLLHGVDQLERLEQTVLLNVKNVNDDAVKFVVLTDLPDSPVNPCPSEDEAFVQQLEAMVERLNATIGERYGRPVHFAHRSRTFVSSEGCWMGRGRKLGKIDLFHDAVLERGRGFAWASAGFYEEIEGCRLVFVCDEDTRIGRNCLQRLAGVLLHPFNGPRIETGSIRSGHGMAVPAPHISSSEVRAWRLPALTVGGVVPSRVEPPRMTDSRQDAFGQALYSGKGLYDLRVHRQVCPRAVQDATLSHDTVESFSLRPTYVGDAAIFEGFPDSVASLERREERWARGDFQNALSAVTKSSPEAFGKLNALSQYTVLRQVLSWTVLWATFPIVLLSLCVGDSVIATAVCLSVMFIPGVIRVAWRFVWDGLVKGQRFAATTVASTFGLVLASSALSIWRSPRTFARLTLAAHRAVAATCTGRRRLLWRTSSQSEGRPSKSGHEGRVLIAPLVAFGAVAWVVVGDFRPHRLLLALPWLLLPLEPYWLNRRTNVHKHRV